MFVAWIDFRTLGNGQDIYAQRITASGEIAPGWPLNGAPVSRAQNYQDLPVLASDGAGGAFVAWEDNRRGVDTIDVYSQHLTPAGGVVGGWPTDGLPVCTASLFSGRPAVIPDESGGVMVAWGDFRRRVLDVYAQHLTASGAIAPSWVANGLLVAPGKGIASVVGDGAGGALIACATKNSIGDDLEYYVQRFTFTGTVAPGWPAGGLRVCTAPSVRENLRAAPDERGGILLTWYDYRTSGSGGDIYALRVRPDGTLAPGWTVNGTRVTDRTNSEFAPDIAPDGAGGAYLTWRIDWGGGARILVQHLTAGGAVAPGWTPSGIFVGASLRQFDPRITYDGSGGAITAWEEYLRGPYAQRFVPDGIVPVLLSLVSAQADPDRVKLVWQTLDALSLHATVERRGEQSDWQPLAAVSADGTGRIEYEDGGVTAGERYAYRLAYTEDGADQHTAETWVDVPQALQLALAGLRPNPAVGELNVWLTLPSAERATLELLDVSGRRVISREVGALGAGVHLVRLDEGMRTSPGVYWLSLRQGGRTLLARAAVIR
ncbi:MAG TPA: T9SS type A sorting domain-containing protein [Candidatus Eisenbacteria bacterium]